MRMLISVSDPLQLLVLLVAAARGADLGPLGITVNAIAPGFFSTETNAGLVAMPIVTEMLQRRTSLGRWGDPREIGGTAVFLASEAASFVTGIVLPIDGGFLASGVNQ